MDTKQKIEVMQAYLDGKEIELSSNGYVWHKIKNDFEPHWDWCDNTYRIKPKPKYRPLKPEELIELKGKWLIHKVSNNNTIGMVIGVSVKDKCVLMLNSNYYIIELFEYWTHEDGSPVGKIDE